MNPERERLRLQRTQWALRISLALLALALPALICRHAFGFHPGWKDCLGDWLLVLLYGTPMAVAAFFLGVNLVDQSRRLRQLES